MSRLIGLAVAATALVLLIRSSLFTVDFSEYVYLTQFGRPVRTFDGGDETDAGLHIKWPWPIQAIQRLDRRLQAFDLPSAELLTHDPRGETIDRTLTVDAYVTWKIDGRDGVDRFVKTLGNADQARQLIGQRIGSELGAAIGQMELDDLFSTQPDRVQARRDRLRQTMLAPWRDEGGIEAEYGIHVIDIRLRRATHPPEVRQAIFDRIRSERGKKSADYESQGAQKASEIASAADQKVQEIVSAAKAEADRIRGQADADAYRIRNEAQGRDPEFYAFLKKLEEYQRILGDNKTLLLLSSHRELFDLLFQPPKPTPPRPAPNAPPGNRDSSESKGPNRGGSPS